MSRHIVHKSDLCLRVMILMGKRTIVCVQTCNSSSVIPVQRRDAVSYMPVSRFRLCKKSHKTSQVVSQEMQHAEIHSCFRVLCILKRYPPVEKQGRCMLCVEVSDQQLHVMCIILFPMWFSRWEVILRLFWIVHSSLDTLTFDRQGWLRFFHIATRWITACSVLSLCVWHHMK